MGFGELSAVEILREAGIVVRSTPGLRTGLVIVDDEGYIFTPTALSCAFERAASRFMEQLESPDADGDSGSIDHHE
jgi:hypothetical protein